MSLATPQREKYGIVDGPFGSNLKTIHYKQEGIPIITSGYVTEGHFCAKDYLYVTEEKFEKEKRSAVRAGDIVMAKIGARCGASAILPENHETGILSGNALKITVDNKRHNTKYIWNMLWRLYYTGKIHSLRTVGAQPAISIASLKKYKITTPPLKEQNRIIRVLDAWDLYLEKSERKIALKKNIKKGLMRQLLTGKKRLNGFNESWKKVPLGEISTVTMGQSPASVFYNTFGNGLPLIQGNADLIDKKTIRRIWTSEVTKIAQRGSIIVTVRAPVGSIGIAQEDVCMGRGVCSIVSDKVNSPFMFYFLESYENQWKPLEQGSTFTAVNSSDIKKINVLLPVTIKEQVVIADILTKADDEIEVLEQKKKIVKNQKKFLLNSLVTGKIRTLENMKA